MLAPDSALGYAAWVHYLGVFDQILIAARVTRRSAQGAAGLPVEGPGVRVLPLPAYQGIGGYLRRRGALSAAVRQAVAEHRGTAADTTAFLALVPGLVGTALTRELNRQGLPFGLEVVGDVAEVLADRRIVSAAAGRMLARQCQQARAVSYVTRTVLQGRYPARADVPTVSCPRVRLEEEDFVAGSRPAPDGWGAVGARHPHPARTVRLLTIGSQERTYKGHDVLVDAVALMRSEGLRLEVTIVGDGRHHDEIVRRAAAHGLGDTVRFVRRLGSRPEVRATLDATDVFVLPSRTEGLPRVLVEAAARALPAVASAVGGVVEILPPRDLVPPDQPRRLAESLTDLIASPDRYAAASERNLATAREYSLDRLRPIRLSFHRTLREITVSVDGSDATGRHSHAPAGSLAGPGR
ncbi:hypothetical protein CcI49_19810 [Frankia sp. CcI49]|uniref:glycosyltransferase n=1 Tax=Frankia sp. CcI49 TaxID=1745382 RepID=UPI0009C85DA1|nr:glycosyltransferase [Frankia sp. CcI49]ONH58958.1 hypothetical protein CcI49_19810 [Frankia sp. CcI49]